MEISKLKWETGCVGGVVGEEVGRRWIAPQSGMQRTHFTMKLFAMTMTDPFIAWEKSPCHCEACPERSEGTDEAI
jgi:hypothetical protein